MSDLKSGFNQCWKELSEKKKIVETADVLKMVRGDVRRLSAPWFDVSLLTPEKFDLSVAADLNYFLAAMIDRYTKEFARANAENEKKIGMMLEKNTALYNRLKNAYQNEHLGEILKKSFEKNKILEFEHEMVQQVDPVYKDPNTTGLINIRTHFFAPRKYFAGTFFDTYWFNICLIWVYSAFLYAALYYDWLKKFMDFFGRLRFKK
jgi:hypothetical protein